MANNPCPRVEFAQQSDEDAVHEMLVLMHEETGMFPMSQPKITECIRAGTQSQGGVIGVIRGPERLEASIGLVVQEASWYTDVWVLSERWCFVHPGHRRAGHALQLVKWAKWAATDRLGVPLQMGVVSTKRTEVKERLFAREMTRVGGVFMYSNGVGDSGLL